MSNNSWCAQNSITKQIFSTSNAAITSYTGGTDGETTWFDEETGYSVTTDTSSSNYYYNTQTF